MPIWRSRRPFRNPDGLLEPETGIWSPTRPFGAPDGQFELQTAIWNSRRRFEIPLRMRILQREAQIQFKEVTFNEILQRVARIYVPGGTFMRILIEIIKFTFKEITFDENPAAGSSNLIQGADF